MEAFTREMMSMAFEGGGVEVRTEEAGEMTVGMFRLPSGTDMRPLSLRKKMEEMAASGGDE